MEIKSPLISIVIVNYNSGCLLENCIGSILNSQYDNYEIIVVDNNSTDNSQNLCKEKFPIIKLIQNNDNLGFCDGNNVGIIETNGEFVILLNPDTEVDKKWLIKLLDAYKKNGDGLFQPKILVLDEPKRINSAGNIINLFGFGYSRGKGDLDMEEFDDEMKINYPSGACLFTSKNIFNKIGKLDSFLWAYHDDLELGWRAAKLGINSFYVPKSVIYHKESSNFRWNKMKFFLLERNRHYCLLIHYSRKTFYKMLPHLILIEILILIYYIKKGLLFEKFRAYLDIIKNIRKINFKHKELEKLRIIDDTIIIKNFQNRIFVPKQVSDKKTNEIFNRIINRLASNFKKSLMNTSNNKFD